MDTVTARLAIPKCLKGEHEELHSTLVRATRLVPGSIRRTAPPGSS